MLGRQILLLLRPGRNSPTRSMSASHISAYEKVNERASFTSQPPYTVILFAAVHHARDSLPRRSWSSRQFEVAVTVKVDLALWKRDREGTAGAVRARKYDAVEPAAAKTKSFKVTLTPLGLSLLLTICRVRRLTSAARALSLRRSERSTSPTR